MLNQGDLSGRKKKEVPFTTWLVFSSSANLQTSTAKHRDGGGAFCVWGGSERGVHSRDRLPSTKVKREKCPPPKKERGGV